MLPGVFSDYSATIVRNARAGVRELAMLWHAIAGVRLDGRDPSRAVLCGGVSILLSLLRDDFGPLLALRVDRRRLIDSARAFSAFD